MDDDYFGSRPVPREETTEARTPLGEESARFRSAPSNAGQSASEATSAAPPSSGRSLSRGHIGRLDGRLQDAFGWQRLGPWRWVLAGSVGVGLLAALAAVFDGGTATAGERVAGALGGLLGWLLLGAFVWVPGALIHRRTQSQAARARTSSISTNPAGGTAAGGTPRWVVVGGIAVAVLVLGAIAVPSFTAQRQKALDARAASGDLREMPSCEAAPGVSTPSAYGTCAESPLSEAFRSMLAQRCGVTLTPEWWRPTPGTVAFFYVIDDDNDARIQPSTGEVDCG